MRFKPYRLYATLTLVTYLALSQWIVLEAHADQCRLALNRDTNPDLEPPTNSGPTFPTNGTESSPTQTRTDSTGGSGTSSPGSAATPTTTIAAFDYANDKIRGVNLGGWLVLEPWITPSVFERTGNRDIIDEYTLGQLMDRQDADALLKQHWETWITEDDFIAIKAAGLNHVRIPVGYWSVPVTSGDTRYSTSPDPYIPGAWPYLLRGLNWARKHGVHVIIDLHGAPGSQNGYDNSGQRTGSPRWALDQDNVGRTVDVVKFIAQNVGGLIDVLELLNEPAGFRGDAWESAVRGFWEDGYDAVREVAGEEMRVMIGDAFLGVNHWTNFLVPPRGHDVLMDFHEYQIFGDDQLDRSVDEHVEFACGYTQTLPNFAAGNIWTVVGEWSNAITDCARWLNGRNVGARWDNTYSDTGRYHGSCDGYTGSFGNFSDSYRQTLRRYFEVQIEIGERVQGWVFWTWKAEEADEWSYQRGLEGGWIPRDPTDRMYPNICS
ncbi:glycoside hydrolase family 5 protein [Coprinellus micaceus]|uniref:glucan 1,3-beta-glucosidase n=1 Tax=Coprinellus micaceus TaxID=71717 RepID=A0A4Y7TGS3_COPMI|nr:glycoside hydrolase family 5 protein [Coprinellus micaceus]